MTPVLFISHDRKIIFGVFSKWVQKLLTKEKEVIYQSLLSDASF